MNANLRIAILIGLLLYFIALIYLLKKRSLTLKYTLLWFFTGFVMTVLTLFPIILEKFLHLIGVVELPNGLFGILVFFIIILLVSLTSIVSKLSNKLRELTQKVAMYEKRIRELEESEDPS